jgi:hypothetical protein
MKKTIILLFVVLSQCCFSYAQNCKNYLLLQNGKTIELTVYNKKGKEDGKQTWKVSNVKSSGSTTTGTVNSSFTDKKGKVLNTAVNEIKCVGGNLQMNLKLLLNEAQLKQMGNAKMTAKGEFIDYPANAKVGDKLKDGNLEMDIKTEQGLDMNLNLEVSNRSVMGDETITSPAGTWDCIKITSTQKITTKVAGIGIPIKMDVTEWFAPGIGVVKTESKYGSTLITSIQ